MGLVFALTLHTGKGIFSNKQLRLWQPETLGGICRLGQIGRLSSRRKREPIDYSQAEGDLHGKTVLWEWVAKVPADPNLYCLIPVKPMQSHFRVSRRAVLISL